ncbi:MAG: primosomal protein N', partial [Moraxella osloensis]
MLIQVALPVPIDSVFDYRVVGDALPAIGCRVRVPFGARKLVGIVVAHIEHSQLTQNAIKPVLDILDERPIVDEALLKLAYWLSAYYCYPLGDVFAVMLPTLIRQGMTLDYRQLCWQQLRDATDEDFSASAKKQRQQFALCELVINSHGNSHRNSHGNATKLVTEFALIDHGVEPAYLKKFEQKGLIAPVYQMPSLPKLA